MLNIAQLGLLAGYYRGSSIPPEAELTAWIDKGTLEGYTLPSQAVQDALNDFIITLKADGLFTRMKTGYIMHAGSKEMGTLNLKDPATFQTSLVNSPTFSEGNGMKSNGTTSYINQPFKSNQYAGIETDLTAISYVSEASTTVNSTTVFGFTTGGSRFNILRPVEAAGKGRSYHHSTITEFNNSEHKGFYVQSATATNVVTWKDGTNTSVVATITAPTASNNRFILAWNSNGSPSGFYPLYVAIDFLFDRFSDTDELNFRTAFNTYKTAVGLP